MTPFSSFRLLATAFALAVPGGFAQQPAAEPPAPPAASAPVALPAEPAVEEKAGLRKLDTPQDGTEPAPPVRSERGGRRRGPAGNQYVPPDRTVREVVALFGVSLVEGRVTGDAVSILGRTQIESGGRVGGGAVAVLGRIDSRGEVGGDTVSVLGATSIDGPVRGDVVTVLGNLHLGPKAAIGRDVVVVGGQLTRDPDAVIRGEIVHLPFLPGWGEFGWLSTWFDRCLTLGRPLAFDARLAWAWVVAALALAFHLLLSVLFPRAVTRCAQTLENRPVGSVLALVLTAVLTPVVFVLLAITIVGALIVPLLGIGLLGAAIFGKTVMLAWLGRRLTGPRGLPVVAVLLGGLLVTLLYTVPVVGFLTFKLLTWLGLGVVVYTVALSMRRESPVAAPAAGGVPVGAMGIVPPMTTPVTPLPPPIVHQGPAVVPPGPAGPAPAPEREPIQPERVESAPFSSLPPPELPPPPVGFTVMTPTLPAAAVGGAGATGPAPLPPPPPPPPPPAPGGRAVPPAPNVDLSWPRAGLMLRLGALALDGILIFILMMFVYRVLPRGLLHDGPGLWFLGLAIYGAVMWKHKGTTIGGVVCGLKVVRLDQREFDWPTAVVRALGCFLSLAVAGLGFIWVAFDDEKQSWHDKIAGTAVVRVPKSVPLV